MGRSGFSLVDFFLFEQGLSVVVHRLFEALEFYIGCARGALSAAHGGFRGGVLWALNSDTGSAIRFCDLSRHKAPTGGPFWLFKFFFTPAYLDIAASGRSARGSNKGSVSSEAFLGARSPVGPGRRTA